MPQNSEQDEGGRVPVGEVRYSLSRFQARQLLLVRRRLQDYADGGALTTPQELYSLATLMWEAMPWTVSTMNQLESRKDRRNGS